MKSYLSNGRCLKCHTGTDLGGTRGTRPPSSDLLVALKGPLTKEKIEEIFHVKQRKKQLVSKSRIILIYKNFPSKGHVDDDFSPGPRFSLKLSLMLCFKCLKTGCHLYFGVKEMKFLLTLTPFDWQDYEISCDVSQILILCAKFLEAFMKHKLVKMDLLNSKPQFLSFSCLLTCPLL